MNINRLKQKSILVISHSYKPLLNPRAFRWTTILEKWAQDGTTINVITSWQPGLAREEIINNVHILRVNNSNIEKLRSRFINSNRKTTAETNTSKSEKISIVNNIIKTTFKKLHDLTWKNLYWPDYATLWKNSAIQNAEYLIKTEQIDTLITISDPFTSHLVGQKLKNKFPQLNWLVDIGDPFSFRHDTPTNNHLLYKKKNYIVEREIFAKANSISVTTESTKNKYAQLFPESADKISVIPPLLSDTTIVDSVKIDRDKIKIVYIGTLYKNIRNPKYLLNLFQELQNQHRSQNLELHFYGAINDSYDCFEPYKEKINKTIFLHGLVDRSTVTHAMTTADILVNIGNKNRYQLPSKVVEYVATKTKIINISQIQNDTSAQFFENYPLCLNLMQKDSNSLTTDVQRVIEFIFNPHKTVSHEFIEKFLEPYKIDSILSSYQNLLNQTNATMNNPTLSVMTPVYNGEDFIARCYFMLCNQTYTDWEWVVVNDGSTDRTEEIIKSFNDSRIKLVTYPNNKGRGYARTEALKAATGEWLVVWDVDDIYLSNRLEKNNQARIAGYDFCCSYVMLIDNDLNTEQIRGFYKDDSGTTKIFVHPTLGCKLDIAKQIGYDPSLPAGEDAALILSLARKFKGQWIEDILTLYQEVREVNIYKTLSSNYGQLASMKILFKNKILDIGYKKYLKMIIKWNIKILILQLFRLAPSLYLKTVALRKSGDTNENWQLSKEQLQFIKEVQKRNINNNWTIKEEELETF